MLRILVTGSREWTDDTALEAALLRYLRRHAPHYQPSEITVRHGGAKGADRRMGRIAYRLGLRVEVDRVTEEEWQRYGKAAGHRRNARMVKRGADVCLAFPIGKSSGTRGCIDLARKAGIPVIVHEGELVAA